MDWGFFSSPSFPSCTLCFSPGSPFFFFWRSYQPNFFSLDPHAGGALVLTILDMLVPAFR